MKLRSKIGAVTLVATMAVFAIGLIGCEEISNAATFDVPITITVRPASDNPTIPNVDTSCTDMSTNQDFMDNKDKIDGGTVKEAFFQITSFIDPVFTSGTSATQIFSTCAFTLTFDPVYMDTRVYNLGTFTNVPLGDLLAGRMAVPVSADFEAAINLIPRRPKFCFQAVYGALNSGPASASRIEGKLDVTVNFKAKAL